YGFRIAAIRRDQVNPRRPWFLEVSPERDKRAIRGPPDVPDSQGEKGELQALAAVRPASPQLPVEGYIGHPLASRRKPYLSDRDTGEVWDKAVRAYVILNQLPAFLRTDEKNPLAVRADQRAKEVRWGRSGVYH